MKQFQILYEDGKARAGKLKTAHGIIETPCFIPVGTQATVKALNPRELSETGAQIVLANTYHLMLRPGADLIESFGGLHRFMAWDRPIMTDSGGFQVFSLGVALEHGGSKVVGKGIRNYALGNRNEEKKPRLNKITEEGVTFQSHIDGSRHTLTPEKSIDIQHKLGADLIVAFDDHESSKHTKKEIEESLELTEKWGLRSLAEHKKREGANVIHPPGGIVAAPLLYGVVHGGTHKDLRVRSAEFTDENFDAIAIGGIYGTHKELYQIVNWVTDIVSQNKPRHLLGIGEVEDLFNGVEGGMDFFDCVAPTRRARNGSLYVSPNSGAYLNLGQYRDNSFAINIRSAKFTKDKNPLDKTCGCYTCHNFSKAYLRHLYFAGEILYHGLASIHNVYFIVNLVRKIREAILEGKFKRLKGEYLS